MLSGLRESIRFCFRCGTRLTASVPTSCPGCGLGHYANPKSCAGALVLSQDRVALVRRSVKPYQQHWDIPGGFCETGEHPAHAAVREVREELGWNVEVVGHLGVWVDTYDDYSGSVTFDTLNHYYCAVPIGDLVTKLDAEITEYAFFEISALPSEIAFPGHVKPVLAALGAAIRDQRVRTALYDYAAHGG